MSQEERTRYHLLRMVLEGRITLKEVGFKMGLSYRQAKRVKKRFVEEGARGLVHGRPSGPEPQDHTLKLQRHTGFGTKIVYSIKFNMLLTVAYYFTVKQGIKPKTQTSQSRLGDFCDYDQILFRTLIK